MTITTDYPAEEMERRVDEIIKKSSIDSEEAVILQQALYSCDYWINKLAGNTVEIKAVNSLSPDKVDAITRWVRNRFGDTRKEAELRNLREKINNKIN